jgi:hypothetical protein
MAKNRSAYAGSRFSVAETTPSFRAFNNPSRSAEHFMAFQTPADANSIHELRTESMCMHVKRPGSPASDAILRGERSAESVKPFWTQHPRRHMDDVGPGYAS